MSRVRIGMIAAGALAATATLAMHVAAQTCAGAASYASGPMSVGAGLTIQNQAKSYGAEFGLGSPSGPFGAVSLARTDYDNVQGGRTGFGVSGGYAVDMNPAKSVQFCPIAGFAYENGPSIPTGFGNVDITGHVIGFGGSFGGVATSTPTFAFVPFASASYMLARANGTFAGTRQSTSQDYEQTEIGAGFVLNRTLTIRPSVAFPIGLPGGKSTFQLGVGFNFGATTTTRRSR